MSGIGAIFGGGAPKAPQIDYAAQAAAQQAAREAEQQAALAADRAEAVAKADEAQAAEASRLKRIKGQSAAVPLGTGQLANVEQTGLKAKLG